jgi:hypothetical protein
VRPAALNLCIEADVAVGTRGNPIDKPGSLAPATGDDKYAKLAKLKQLLDSGAITQEEFNLEKGKILAQQ